MFNQHFSPPPLAERLVSHALDEEERSARLGDLEERYQYLVREWGERRARAWYRQQALQLVISAVIHHILWSSIMFKNNLVIAWRNIKRNKVYSALNIFGLAAGMAVFILIMLYVRYELSYDRYHAKPQNIYRIIYEDPVREYRGSNVYARTPGPMAPALIQEFPEMLSATRITGPWSGLIGVDGNSFMVGNCYWADPETFDIFSFPLVRGNRAAVLKNPFSVLLSEREARRLFGDTDPIGRTISLLRGRAVDFKVEGVFRDIPANSHFDMDLVLPFETQPIVRGQKISSWNRDLMFITYIRLKDGCDARTFEAKFPAFAEKHGIDKADTSKAQRKRFLLQPLTQIHLRSGINFELSPTADIRFVVLFASIAILILVIACINYTNLATARSLKRIKEVGVRKVVGAAKGQIVRQFLGDSLMSTFLALFLAIGIVLAFLSAFRAFVEREIFFNPFHDIALMPALILLFMIVGTIAGSYPAFFVSAFRPVSALMGRGFSVSKGRGLRNALIVFQFAASIALIICTVGVQSQLHFIRNRDMGYQREQIVVLSPPGDIQGNLEVFKTELKRYPAVLNVTASGGLPNRVYNTTIANWPGRPDSVQIPVYYQYTDFDYIDVYGMKIIQGRNFSHEFPSDAEGAFLINESAKKAFGWEDPVGRELIHSYNGMRGKIVGVVRDFHLQSLHLPIAPLCIILPKNLRFYANVSIKIRGENIPETLAFIRKTWEQFSPQYPFEYSFFDEIFDKDYRNEQRLGKIFSAFAGLAVLIACLGLVGLASFTAERRTKEIGIRKVLGASTSGVIALLSREFMKWVVLANLIAWPIGYFAMRSWLRNFAYRTSLTVPMFLGAALAALAIAASIISLQTYRAASANPADSLRYE